MFILSAGVLVDNTGEYSYVFIACSTIVASSALFLMASFFFLDKKERAASQQGKPFAQPDPTRPAAADASPGCIYSGVPTEGGKNKGSPNGAEYITNV